MSFLAAIALAAAAAGARPTAPPRPSPPPPARIASLNLAADEILIELVPADRLVMVTSFADDPENSNIVGRIPAGIPRISRAKMERLVEVHPDLAVVSQYSEADFLHLLSESGVAHHRVVVNRMKDVPDQIRALGQATGTDEAAGRLVTKYEGALADLDRRLEGAPRPRVLLWSEPYTAGTETVMGDVIERAGGMNLARELGVTGFTPVPVERAFTSNPDFIVVREGKPRANLLAHPILSKLAAVQKGHIVEMPGRYLSTLSHHTADAAEFLARALHPDRFDAQTR
jgi:iron complex transport system substrate-binding protein